MIPEMLNTLIADVAQENLSCWYTRCRTAEHQPFHVSLDRQWRPVMPRAATLVSQSRMVYNFAQGYRLCGDERYRASAVAGARTLLDLFLDRTHGGFFLRWEESKGIVSDVKDSYGHAFVMLALLSAWQVSGDRRFALAARETGDLLCSRFRDHRGALYWHCDRFFTPQKPAYSQNPLMHTFESFLFCYHLCAGPATVDSLEPNERRAWLQWCETALDGVFALLFDRCEARRWLLPEEYDEQWRPRDPAAGGVVLTGHLFEWSFLLSFAAIVTKKETYMRAARGCFDAGISCGVDLKTGRLSSRLDYCGTVVEKDSFWWEYAEALRATLHFGVEHGDERARAFAPVLFEHIADCVVDKTFGGWFPHIDNAGKPRETYKGNLWKLDYHQMACSVEAHRLRALLNRSVFQ